MADLVINGVKVPDRRTIELMRTELACVSRSEFDRHCKDCDLVQDADELIAAFCEVITVLETVANAVPLPEGHGRLGDFDKLYAMANERSMGIHGPVDYMCVITGNDILNAPTIIPAEGGTDECSEN